MRQPGAPHLVRGPRSFKLRETTKTPDAASLSSARASRPPPLTLRGRFVLRSRRSSSSRSAGRLGARRCFRRRRRCTPSARRTASIWTACVFRVWWMRNGGDDRTRETRDERGDGDVRRVASSRRYRGYRGGARPRFFHEQARRGAGARAPALRGGARGARGGRGDVRPSTRGSPRSRRCTSRAPRLTAPGTSSPLGSISTARSTRAPPTRTSTRRRSSPSCDSASRATRRRGRGVRRAFPRAAATTPPARTRPSSRTGRRAAGRRTR